LKLESLNEETDWLLHQSSIGRKSLAKASLVGSFVKNKDANENTDESLNYSVS